MLWTMCVCHVYGRLKRPTPVLAANIQLIEHYLCTIHRAMERQEETNKKCDEQEARPYYYYFASCICLISQRRCWLFPQFLLSFFASFSFCSSLFLFWSAERLYISGRCIFRRANRAAAEISDIHNKCVQFHSILVLCNEAISPRTICSRN